MSTNAGDSDDEFAFDYVPKAGRAGPATAASKGTTTLSSSSPTGASEARHAKTASPKVTGAPSATSKSGLTEGDAHASPSSSSPTPPPRKRTVYEMERDAKVAEVLQQQGLTRDVLAHPPGEEHSSEEASTSDAVLGSVADYRASPVVYRGRGGRGRYGYYNGRGGGGGGGQERYSRADGRYGGDPASSTAYTSAEGGPSMLASSSPSSSASTTAVGGTSAAQGLQQRRFQNQPQNSSFRRNLFVMRNALKEVDPDTKELMLVTYTPSEGTIGAPKIGSTNRYARGGGGGGYGNERGRGGGGYRGGDYGGKRPRPE